MFCRKCMGLVLLFLFLGAFECSAAVLEVSPANISTILHEGDGEQTFTLYLADRDAGTAFNWQAVPDRDWIAIDPSTGTGPGAITVTVSTATLSPGNYRGAVVIYSDIGTSIAGVQLEVAALTSAEFTVSPSYLLWSTQIAVGADIPSFSSEALVVSGGRTGWTVSFNVPWLTVSVGGADTNSLVSEQAENIVVVQPVSSVLSVGVHQTYITITGDANGFYRKVPVYVDIRNPGDPVFIPSSLPEGIQSGAGFVMIEACDAHSLNINLSLAGMAVTDKAYVLLELPFDLPDRVYAFTPGRSPVLQLAEKKSGIVVPNADDLFYSPGPVPRVPIYGLPLRGLSGLWIKTMAGPTYAGAEVVQNVYVNISTLEGSWQVTETFNGAEYTDPPGQFLTIKVDGAGYRGTWGGTPVGVSYGDGESSLYRISLGENGYRFVYDVQSLSAFEMKGVWAWNGGQGGTFRGKKSLVWW